MRIFAYFPFSNTVNEELIIFLSLSLCYFTGKWQMNIWQIETTMKKVHHTQQASELWACWSSSLYFARVGGEEFNRATLQIFFPREEFEKITFEGHFWGGVTVVYFLAIRKDKKCCLETERRKWKCRNLNFFSMFWALMSDYASCGAPLFPLRKIRKSVS